MRKTSIIASGLAAVVLLAMIPLGTFAAKTDIRAFIDQITDPTAGRVLDMFRFEPDFVVLETGEKVTFNNSFGQHTVVSVKGLIPEGTEKISIANTSSETRTMDVPGLYVLTCKVHGRYGMLMLIAVGAPDTWQNPPETWTRQLSGRYDEKLQELLGKLNEAFPS